MIENGKDVTLDRMSGSSPRVHVRSWLQKMKIVVVTKKNVNFRVVEEVKEVDTMAIIMPFTEEQLKIQPIGQRSRDWYKIYSDPFLELTTDDKIIYQGFEYQIMSVLNYKTYGYFEYSTVKGFQ